MEEKDWAEGEIINCVAGWTKPWSTPRGARQVPDAPAVPQWALTWPGLCPGLSQALGRCALGPG